MPKEPMGQQEIGNPPALEAEPIKDLPAKTTCDSTESRVYEDFDEMGRVR